jgi:hypothetical protein
VLQFTQTTYCRIIMSRNHEMEPAQTFYRDDLSNPKRLGGFGEGVKVALVGLRSERSFDCPVALPELKVRPADGAGIGLGMKPPIQRVIVLVLAPRTHHELLHRGVGAIVRE